MEEPADPNFVEDMADVEARNYQQMKDKGISIFAMNSNSVFYTYFIQLLIFAHVFRYNFE